MRTLSDVFGELHAPDEYACLLVGPMGRIRDVDGKVEALFGYGMGELVDQPLAILIPERFRDAHASLRNAFNERPIARASKGRELFGLRKDGTEIAVEIGLVPVTADGGTFTLAIIRQITDLEDDNSSGSFET